MNKQNVHAKLQQFLSEKRELLQADMAGIAKDMANDTKSSAGDKFETSREMTQQAMDKLNVQLAENMRFTALLEGLITSATEKATHIQAGSLVETEIGWLFIGIPLGNVTVDGTAVFCLGAASPLAQAILGKQVSQQIIWQGKQVSFMQIL